MGLVDSGRGWAGGWWVGGGSRCTACAPQTFGRIAGPNALRNETAWGEISEASREVTKGEQPGKAWYYIGMPGCWLEACGQRAIQEARVKRPLKKAMPLARWRG